MIPNRKISATLAAAAATALLLASCGTSEAVQNPGIAAAPAVSPGAALAPSTAPSFNPTAPAVSQQPAVTVVPSASPTPAVAVKQYRINKNYDVVPLDTALDANKKVVLLTFDDGPKKSETLTLILDTLDKHKAKAIFFVNGNRVKQNPDLLKLIQQRKQTIGNHTWDHVDLKKEPPEKVDTQIGDVQTIVKELTGEAPVFFRPPNGSGSDYVREAVKKAGMVYMTWSNGSLDWDTKTADKPQEVIDNVLKQLHAGSNILMHELTWTAEALDKLLTELEAKGYSFVDPAAIALE
ncbi:MAG: hypothetical protein K0Q90_3716 [Paenibacillaceae bacterium]|jgi:peptidoglycan/xylan/chitin deacetylase (PgdA/CDA1 family)|nr:hypothetical protein [Paenibacillaceae bacterium]